MRYSFRELRIEEVTSSVEAQSDATSSIIEFRLYFTIRIMVSVIKKYFVGS